MRDIKMILPKAAGGKADSISSTMKDLGYDVVESDVFENKPNGPADYKQCPYEIRLRLLWEDMRNTVIGIFPESPGQILNPEEYLHEVEEKYLEDAYHSLSIAGYQVSPELIEKVCSGD